MAFISEKDTAFLQTKFAEELKQDVTITHFTRQPSSLVVPGQEKCHYCKETKELIEEIVGLSEHLKLKIVDIDADPQTAKLYGVDTVPVTDLSGPNSKGKVRYLGIPMGHEFTPFIETLFELGTAAPELSAKTLERLATVQKPVHLEVFVTPT